MSSTAQLQLTEGFQWDNYKSDCNSNDILSLLDICHLIYLIATLLHIWYKLCNFALKLSVESNPVNTFRLYSTIGYDLPTQDSMQTVSFQNLCQMLESFCSLFIGLNHPIPITHNHQEFFKGVEWRHTLSHNIDCIWWCQRISGIIVPHFLVQQLLFDTKKQTKIISKVL